jgi:hypothetical protein
LIREAETTILTPGKAGGLGTNEVVKSPLVGRDYLVSSTSGLLTIILNINPARRGVRGDNCHTPSELIIPAPFMIHLTINESVNQLNK